MAENCKIYTPDKNVVGIYNDLYSRYLERCRIEEDLKK